MSAWPQQRVKRPSPTPGVRPEPRRASSSDAAVDAVPGADAAHQRPGRRAECAAAAGASPGAESGRREAREGGRGLGRVGEERRVEPSRGGVVAVRLEVDLRGPQWRGKRAAGFTAAQGYVSTDSTGSGNMALMVREYGSAGYVSTDRAASEICE